MSSLSMSDAQFKKLRDIIYDRSGITFPDAKKYVLESRLSQRLRELEIDDFDQYAMLLDVGPYQKDEFQAMFNRITINETSFFRNEPQLDVFENRILPELLEARASSKRLRIWSAACSSGEEPHTLAIQVHRTLGSLLRDWTVEILGTDISEKMLEVANSGVYTDYAVRSTSSMIKSRYFKQTDAGWELNQEIRDMVRFEVHNLRDRMAAKRHGTWDVIFCRNVMIYFDNDMKKQVVDTFADQLGNDGVLFIGHSESIRELTDRFEPAEIPQGFCYRPLKNAASPGLTAKAA
ncbi:MAG: protein-glutamate O-methyltransferase CheR [Planctomycetota bacterium]